MAFGDSITLGEDGTTTLGAFDLAHFLRPDYPTIVLVGREYPTVLRGLLAARYTTQQLTMVNAGRQAERLSDPDTLRRFTDVVASRAYDVVLLMEGTNDIYGGTGGNPLGIPPAITNLRQMVRDARSRGVRVFLATVPPQNPAGRRGALGYQVVPLLNAEIRTLALTEGVPLVDVYDAFNGNLGLLAGDGLHPNADGFARIAAKFYDVVQERLEAPRLGPVPVLVSGVEDAWRSDRTSVFADSARQ
ncbi:MAG: SGNH/GDSL hydrolase family protein [Vicinamibacterales bacterium]